MGNVIAYTDGASSGNPGPSGWAVLINGELVSDWVECATNNQMELFAAYQAVYHCPAYSHLTIYTDSQVAMGYLSRGMSEGRKNLLDIVEAFMAVADTKQITVALRKVKGHGDCKENRIVDRAAVAQCRIARVAIAARSEN